MSTLELKVYEIFKSKFSEQEAATVIEYFEVKAKEVIEEKGQSYQSLQNKDMEILRNEMHNLFATKKDIASLEVKIVETKSEMIKWMFIFWIGQVAVTVGLIMIYLKK